MNVTKQGQTDPGGREKRNGTFTHRPFPRLQWIKQRLDRMAISMATRSLPEPTPNPKQRADAERLIENPDLFRPPEMTADPAFANDKLSFTFASAVTSSSPKNNVAHGKLYRCEAAWQMRPTVVLVHGWNAELHYIYGLPRLARLLNAQGMNAILLELPYHLHRRPERRAGMCDFICDNIPGMLHATRQALADIHSVLRWARAQGCPATGLWGFSLGAWLAGLHVCHAGNQDAAILTTPVSNLERGIAELPFCFPIRAALEVAPVPLARLNLQSQRPTIDPERILVSQGVHDMFVPSDTYSTLAEAWNLRGWEVVAQSHISILASPRTMRGNVAWLKETLGRGR